MPELAVYTCISGGYDDLRQPIRPEPSVDYVCFTDAKPEDPGVWRIKPLPAGAGNSLGVARYVKMHPHILLEEYSKSLWIDGNVRIRRPIAPLAAELLEDADIALYRHPFRGCTYEEMIKCARLGHDWVGAYLPLRRRYDEANFPPDAGLLETNVIFRNHHDEKIIDLMEEWWRYNCTYTRRDQLSFRFLAWTQGIQVKEIGTSDLRSSGGFFELETTHRKKIPYGRYVKRAFNHLVLQAAPSLLSPPPERR